MTLFDSCCADIKYAYHRLGCRLGWRFLSESESTLSLASRIAFITLNPGGDYDSPGHPRERQEAGSASWKAGIENRQGNPNCRFRWAHCLAIWRREWLKG